MSGSKRRGGAICSPPDLNPFRGDVDLHRLHFCAHSMSNLRVVLFSLFHNIKPASELATGTDYNIFRYVCLSVPVLPPFILACCNREWFSVNLRPTSCANDLFLSLPCREGIEPAWEHPGNARGGKWMVSLPPKQRPNLLDQRWMFTLLACIGETLEDVGSEETLVCGTVLSVRKQADRLAVWTRAASEEQIMSIGRKFQAALADYVKGDQITFNYYLHDAAAQASKSKNVPAKYTLPPLP